MPTDEQDGEADDLRHRHDRERDAHRDRRRQREAAHPGEQGERGEQQGQGGEIGHEQAACLAQDIGDLVDRAVEQHLERAALAIARGRHRGGYRKEQRQHQDRDRDRRPERIRQHQRGPRPPAPARRPAASTWPRSVPGSARRSSPCRAWLPWPPATRSRRRPASGLAPRPCSMGGLRGARARPGDRQEGILQRGVARHDVLDPAFEHQPSVAQHADPIGGALDLGEHVR